MPAAPNVAQPEPELVHRSVRLRLLPESRARAHQLAGTAGACRFVWNHFVSLKRQQYRAYRCWQDYKIGPERHKPNLTFFGMGLEFTALRRDPRYAWLQEYSFGEVRYVLKHLADAYRAFFQGTRGQPRFQSRHRRADGFTIPQQVRVRGPQLYVPRVGWLRVRGYNPHAAGQVRQARLRQEGTASRPRWYVYLVYAVPADSVRQGAESGVLGLDRNVGQVTDSAGRVYRLTDLTRLEAKVARYQRRQARQQRGSVRARRLGGQLQKLRRQQQRIRANDTHQISRALADQAHTLVVEDLHTQGMTQSAKGTQQSPGTHVKAKAGLNRGILASNWGQLAQRLQYKCGQLVRVDPRYTSQTCHQCEHVAAGNRPAQAVFRCQRCGLLLNADHNAALNIRGRYARPGARGTGAAARREAFPSGTSPTREHGMPESVYSSILSPIKRIGFIGHLVSKKGMLL